MIPLCFVCVVLLYTNNLYEKILDYGNCMLKRIFAVISEKTLWVKITVGL